MCQMIQETYVEVHSDAQVMRPLARLTVNEIQACPTFVPFRRMCGQTRLTKLESFHTINTPHFPHMT
jgi:hypothetical protein